MRGKKPREGSKIEIVDAYSIRITLNEDSCACNSSRVILLFHQDNIQHRIDFVMAYPH
jgi:hypothetical protein